MTVLVMFTLIGRVSFDETFSRSLQTSIFSSSEVAQGCTDD